VNRNKLTFSPKEAVTQIFKKVLVCKLVQLTPLLHVKNQTL